MGHVVRTRQVWLFICCSQLFSLAPYITQTVLGQAAQLHATSKISARAVWFPSEDFLRVAQAACGKSASRNLVPCFLEQMAKSGAPPEAVKFSRLLYENSKQFGVMYRFQSVGPVDMAQVFYPLRDASFPYAVASMRYGLLLVNGDPPILDVDDLKRLDMRGLEQDPGYKSFKTDSPRLQIWGGGRSGSTWPPVQRRDGGLSFDLYYYLNQGRPAGRWQSGAHFDWNFDAAGKFLGTKFTGGIGPPID
jgi:hypothetical protein